MYLKCLDKLQGWILHIREVRIHICLKMNGFWIWLKFYIQQDVLYLSCIIFYLTTDIIHLHYTFPISELPISNCLASDNSEPMLKISSTWINARLDTSDHRLSFSSTGPREVLNGYRASKCADEMSLYFQSELIVLGILSVPADKNVRDWVNM